jgi:hypothetical protein
MLHDGVAFPQPYSEIALERRSSPRTSCTAELTLTWLHDSRTPVRYHVLDAGEGGFRILTATPLLEGMTGIAWKLLPEGRPIRRTVVVAWIASTADGMTEAGLRFL